MKRGGVVVLLLLAGCAPDFRDASRLLAQSAPAPREPLAERRTIYFDAQHTRVRRQWGVLIQHDNSTVLHGSDEQFFADGTPEYVRHYDHGEPCGAWRAFWVNGRPKMEAEYGASEPRPMRWWHENGQLSSEGLASNGLKEGEWTFWHDNGAKLSTGRYVGGRREGTWLFWTATGAPLEALEFRGDVRVRKVPFPGS